LLYRANGNEFIRREVGSFELPISNASWTRKIHEFVKLYAREWTHLEAASGALSFQCEELGEYRLSLSREVKPVRWACKTIHDQIQLRLIDDTGNESYLSATARAFADPFVAQQLSVDELERGMRCAAPGGLFVAEKGNTGDTIIVSSPEVEGGLQALGVTINISTIDPATIDVPQHLRQIELWMKARLAGPLASFRRDRVVRALCQILYARLCGTRWARAEAAFLDNPQSQQLTDQLITSVDRTPGFAIVLQRDGTTTQIGTRERARWFGDLARSFRVCGDARLSEFALMVAGQPHQVPLVKREEMDPLLHQLNERPALLRGARLLALLDVAKRAGGVGSTIPRWAWRS